MATQFKTTGFICGPALYKFDGWFFEIHSYCGPWPLKVNGELRKRAGRKFYKMFDKFSTLSLKEREKFNIHSGGCIKC